LALSNERAADGGLFVLLVGPDGSGKSSLAPRLAEAARREGRPVRHMHWRPGILPQAATLGGVTPDPSRPHAGKPHGRLLSLFRLIYYWIDFSLGLRLRALPIRRRGGLVVMERGWWDFAVDPRRYRMTVSPRLVERLGYLLRPPDLVICLEAPPEILAERKRELPLGELDRQIARWRRIRLPKRAVRVYLDASLSLEDLVRQAKEHMAELLERDHSGRGAARYVPRSR
jgi:thymidylate kinase